MSSKRQQQEYEDRQLLKHHGWQVSKRDSIAFNGANGAESPQHLMAKALACQVLKDHGFRISTEVSHSERGEIDCVAYGKEEPPFAVEVETHLDQETKQSKVDRYVKGTPIRDIFFVRVEEMPETIIEAKAFIEHELFGMSAE